LTGLLYRLLYEITQQLSPLSGGPGDDRRTTANLRPGRHRSRLAALEAQVSLSGARAQRARETIADALTHVERLAFFVEGDSQ
jgi:hypothetical protein